MITLDGINTISFGERIKRLLKFKGWTQRNLALTMETDESQISTLVNNKRKAGLYEVRVLATVLRVPYEFLLGEMPLFDDILVKATNPSSLNTVNLWK